MIDIYLGCCHCGAKPRNKFTFEIFHKKDCLVERSRKLLERDDNESSRLHENLLSDMERHIMQISKNTKK